MNLNRLLLIASSLSFVGSSGAGELPRGLSATQPDSGRFVQTDQGYMIPYTMEIPGTEITFSMEPIPGGSFLMGSPPGEEGREPDEGPQIQLEVKPFWMGKYEVSWKQYKEFMNLYAIFKDFESQGLRPVTDANRVDAITAPTELYDPSFTFEFGEDPQQPAVTMTQYAAKQYTKWLTAITGQQYRLPSEAEWEYACRAGTTGPFSFSGDYDEYVWYFDNAEVMPNPVGQKKPNPWGLHDMHGNVWEWVLDGYTEDGYQHLAGTSRTAQQAINWPTELFPRTLRGGSWDDDLAACRSASRMPSHDYDWKSEDPNLPLSPWWFTSDPSRAVGFRILRPLEPLPREEMVKYWEADVEEIDFDVTSRLDEGRGALGLVDEQLPAAIQALKDRR